MNYKVIFKVWLSLLSANVAVIKMEGSTLESAFVFVFLHESHRGGIDRPMFLLHPNHPDFLIFLKKIL